MGTIENTTLYAEIITLLKSARKIVIATVVITYFEIGKMIVEEEQKGKDRAKYGKQLLKGLSQRLIKEFGRGFSVDNLENMRRFYISYKKSETVSRKFSLSWSHYLKLIRINDENERKFYEIQSFKNN